MTRVLVVDDEPQILRALRINLRARQYDVVTAATGAQALEQAATHPPDLVILDLGLPDMPGIDVIGGLRGWTAVPIIVLSGRADSTDKVDALDAGADDYVTKPFGMDELLARMRAATRRSPVAEAPPRIQLGGLTIDLAAKRVIRPGGPPASGTSGGGEEDEAGAHAGRLRAGNANDVPGGDAGIGEAGAGGGTLREADGGTAGLHGRDVTVRGADEAGDDRMSVAGDAALRGAAGGTADDGAGFGAGGARGTGGDQGGGHGAVGRGAGVAGGTGDDAMDLGAGGGYGTGADQGHGHGAGGHPADLTGGGVGEVGGGGGGSRARSEGTGAVSGAGGQADGDVRLTPTEWHLLEVLLRNPGKLLSHRQLLNDVWGPGYDNAGGNLRLYMAQLRRKLEPDPARPRWLITEPGMGYRYQPSAPDDQPPPG